MILINLLPHREARREQKKKDFTTATAGAFFVGAAIAALWYMSAVQAVSDQTARNDRIKEANAVLAKKIEEVKNLEEEIYALKLRRDAVEKLQTDRNMPTQLLNELVEHTPEGVRLLTLKQVDAAVTLTGIAQTNERISVFLNNLSTKTAWLTKPDLVEIQSSLEARNKEQIKLYRFSINLTLKKPEPPAPADGASSPPAN